MSKVITREFAPADRYKYDFGLCSIKNGWAQIDTRQDASYFGQWVNPAKRQVFCYCEGDISLVRLDTDAELVAELALIRDFHNEDHGGFLGIDSGFSEPLKQACVNAGLDDFFHHAEIAQ